MIESQSCFWFRTFCHRNLYICISTFHICVVVLVSIHNAVFSFWRRVSFHRQGERKRLRVCSDTRNRNWTCNRASCWRSSHWRQKSRSRVCERSLAGWFLYHFLQTTLFIPLLAYYLTSPVRTIFLNIRSSEKPVKRNHLNRGIMVSYTKRSFKTDRGVRKTTGYRFSQLTDWFPQDALAFIIGCFICIRKIIGWLRCENIAKL